MGNCCGLRRRRLRRHIVLILIGLDNAGKTKTVNNLAGEKDDKVLPTVGFKAVNLIHKDTPVTIYDLGGGPHFRQIWPQYYSEVHGVIFVIDSSDYTRLEECKVVLEEVLSHDKISGKPVLVLANKQDKSGALDDMDVVEKLNIEPLVNKYRCPTLVESYSASADTNSKKPKIDPGLRKGYHWLLNYIVKRYGDINLRVQTDIHAELERRKRMMNRASNRASQTFTAVSDDIATQTGFENPNFDVQKSSKSSEIDSKELDKGVIFVKPIKNPNSLDSTVTIESVEESDQTSGAGKPKLSPLFGRASNTSTSETVRIELEPRSEFRKLSPIVRKKSGVNHIDFKNRPQSSPSYVRNKLPQSSKNSSIEEEPADKTVCLSSGPRTRGLAGAVKHRVLDDPEALKRHVLDDLDGFKRCVPDDPEALKRRVLDDLEGFKRCVPDDPEALKRRVLDDLKGFKRCVPDDPEALKRRVLDDLEGLKRCVPDDPEALKRRVLDDLERVKHRVLVNNADLALMHREIVLTERDRTSKATSSDIVAGAATLPVGCRPASASQLLRRQLEMCPTPHKRRLSLRYMQRNKTSPESNTMLLYEPKQRHLDKGDFEHSATIN